MNQTNLGKVFKSLGSVIGLIGLSLVLSFLTPAFLTVNNILNVLRQVSVISILAAGETFVILTGGIDLSVGSMLGLCGVMLAGTLNRTGSPLLAVLAGLSLGGSYGVD